FGWGFVQHLLRQYWSPEQINGRLKAKVWQDVPSIERIYQFIYTDKSKGGKLHTYLRCQKKKRKRYASGQDRRGQIINRAGIEERPVIANKRERTGDFEGDTITGAKHKGAILTLVERMARLIKLRPLQDKQARKLAHSNIEVLQGLEVNTITCDNGKEFADHEEIGKALRC
ncbi:MAG: IS30 family transposase, partial [Pseudoalteromonas sp.]|nr:IS30 family transposase [Pseudoalteromonas sp.]